MAPLIAAAIKLLLPVAVSEVQKKLNVPVEEAAPIAVKAAVVGSVKSKTAWLAFAIALAGFFEQNQQLITNLVGPGYSGYVIAGVGAVMWYLRTVSTDGVVDKILPKE